MSLAATKKDTRFKTRASQGAKFVRLKQLRCFTELHERTANGWPISEIARWVQVDKGEYTDVTRGSLTTLLHDYRNALPRTALLGKIPSVVVKAKEEVEKGLDELKELERLYTMQLERIQIDFNTEKQIKKLMPTMTQEIREAKSLLETYTDLKVALGLNATAVPAMDGEVTLVASIEARYGTKAVAKVMGDPESRRKVLGVAQRLLSLGKQAAEVIDITEIKAARDKASENSEAAGPGEEDSPASEVLPEDDLDTADTDPELPMGDLEDEPEHTEGQPEAETDSEAS